MSTAIIAWQPPLIINHHGVVSDPLPTTGNHHPSVRQDGQIEERQVTKPPVVDVPGDAPPKPPTRPTHFWQPLDIKAARLRMAQEAGRSNWYHHRDRHGQQVLTTLWSLNVYGGLSVPGKVRVPTLAVTPDLVDETKKVGIVCELNVSSKPGEEWSY